MQHTVANIIKCASASMMARRTMPANPAVPETPVLKRKASVMDEVPEEAAPGCTPLERAMADVRLRRSAHPKPLARPVPMWSLLAGAGCSTARRDYTSRSVGAFVPQSV